MRRSLPKCVLALLASGRAVLAAACASKPPPPAAALVSPTAYDGTYKGTVAVTYVNSGADPKWCETDKAIALQIANGAFTYAQAHPLLVLTPGTGTTTATYVATVAPDGSFSATSAAGGQFTGKIAGTKLTGTINGIGCSYSLSADRA
jgi:hypothetical protein